MGWEPGVLEFCLFLVVFSAMCDSSVSARFLIYGAAHTVCFLSLVAILDPLLRWFSMKILSIHIPRSTLIFNCKVFKKECHTLKE
jgi:hypothetical protein